MGKYEGFEDLNIFEDLPINIELCGHYSKKDRIEIVKLLNEFNITNLAQLFEAYDRGVFNDGRKKYNKAIKGTIELLRFKYLQEDIISDLILSEKVGYDKDDFGKKLLDSLSWHKLIRLLGTRNGIIIYNYFNSCGVYKNEIGTPTQFNKDISFFELLDIFASDMKYHYFFLKDNGGYRNADFFEFASESLNDILKRIELLREYHVLKSEKNSSEDLSSRKKELDRLLEQRKILDSQIATASEIYLLTQEGIRRNEKRNK